MASLGPYLVGIAFWVFVGAVAITGTITDYKRRRGSVEILRMAIDKGQQLDPALIDKLTSNERRDDEINSVHVKLGGIVTIASGVGVCLLSYFISRIAPIALYPILGAGVVAICVGTGLIIGAQVLEQARERGGRDREHSRDAVP